MPTSQPRPYGFVDNKLRRLLRVGVTGSPQMFVIYGTVCHIWRIALTLQNLNVDADGSQASRLTPRTGVCPLTFA